MDRNPFIPQIQSRSSHLGSDGDGLLRVSRFVACEPDADREDFVVAKHDLDCTLDPIGCLIALTMTAKDFGISTARVAAFDLAQGGSN